MKDYNKRVKQIAIVDSSHELVEKVLEFIDDKFEFEITTRNDADYVFHSVHGYDVLQYKGVRIFVSGENVSPNFLISDYAMTFDRLEFGDRYIWLPLIKLYREAYSALCMPRPPVHEIIPQKTDFCAYVMSNLTNSAEERSRIFDILSAYKPVNSGGLWHNNVGGRVSDKLSFQSKHKFVIAFENCSYPGYLTEKFAEAAASNAVPIYWGDPQIASLFNPKAFVNCHDFPSLEAVGKRVREIDNDTIQYQQMLTEPWFSEGREPEFLRDEVFTQFLENIFKQDPKSAYRRNRGRWGQKKEKQLDEMWSKPHLQGLKILRNRWRLIYRKFVPKRKRY